MRICWLGESGELGAGIYSKMVLNALSKHYEVETVKIKPGALVSHAHVASLTNRLDEKYDVVIRGFHDTIPLIGKMNRAKNITILQFALYRSGVKKIAYTFDKLFLKNIKNVDVVVTVSKYMKNLLEANGNKNTRIAYNAFEIDKFKISKQKLSEFKQKYNLTGKPVIYIGNCRKEKGVLEVYEELKDLDAHLVSSGKKMVDVPSKNFELSYDEHIILLKSSDIVINMSKIPEAWNRTAHEGMLCRKPVIGSGSGGMEELLNGGKQIICKNFGKLRPIVEQLLEDRKTRKKLGNTGYKFASKFTSKKFEKEWVTIIEELSKR
ncbi:Glycosyl transferases group 1 [Geoglobus ahangari]|uniref:Glycosyl transferases group 1 n=1 Tax=Geoglobus ahangari TaxID=113653 RepID=A0A0F7IJL0_9EURY|nr:glycosyltransferase [Geoglobus ahangari]AKG92425.1 Glycosyl transferases group 1 [Geoglobus ahangari]